MDGWIDRQIFNNACEYTHVYMNARVHIRICMHVCGDPDACIHVCSTHLCMHTSIHTSCTYITAAELYMNIKESAPAQLVSVVCKTSWV